MKPFLLCIFLFYLFISTTSVPCTPSQDNNWGQSQGVLENDNFCPKSNCFVSCKSECNVDKAIYFPISGFTMYLNAGQSAEAKLSSEYDESCGKQKNKLQDLLTKYGLNFLQTQNVHPVYKSLPRALNIFIYTELRKLCSKKSFKDVLLMWKDFANSPGFKVKPHILKQYTELLAIFVIKESIEFVKKIEKKCNCKDLFKRAELTEKETKAVLKELKRKCGC